MLTNIPTPDPIAKAHSEQLQTLIAAEIAAKGPMTLARYMQMALYQPGFGYYSAGAHKFGEAGDFITAPELSPLFAKCLANQCQQVLSTLPGGDIVELGAGSGVMALELLKALQAQAALPQHYYIVEVSADLRQRQQQLLRQAPELYVRVQWLDALPSEPINGVIVGNEVVDAMPVHKFKQRDSLQECYVDYQAGHFEWIEAKPSDPLLQQRVDALGIQFAPGYESEMNLLLPAWIASLANCLQQGVILLIDYGFPQHEYYHPDRSMGTLMCHYRHRAHDDLFFLPGLQDITTHVDFTAIAQAAVDNGLDVVGFTHQAGFLMNCGITQFLTASDDLQQFNLNQQVKRLTLPSEMGELFKAIALSKHFDAELIGFRQMNQLERL